MERALLVGIQLNNGEDYALSLEELESLANACEMEVVGIVSRTFRKFIKLFISEREKWKRCGKRRKRRTWMW